MGKEKTSQSQLELKDEIISTKRPVSKEDHCWCKSQPQSQLDVDYQSYVYTLPLNVPLDLSWLTGYIVRTKKIKKSLLIQVVKTETKRKKGYYVVYISYKDFKKTPEGQKPYIRRFLNIRYR